jgi:hypothetical protein
VIWFFIGRFLVSLLYYIPSNWTFNYNIGLILTLLTFIVFFTKFNPYREKGDKEE